MRRAALALAGSVLLHAAACAPATRETALRPDAATTQPFTHTAVTGRDRADVLAVMERLFDAMRARDSAAIRAIAHPELRIFVSLTQAGAPALRTVSLEDFMRTIAAADAYLDETVADPELRIDGDLATIWTYYDFVRGGRFSHCGYDSFQLARTTRGWTIVGLAYTHRTEDCRPRQ